MCRKFKDNVFRVPFGAYAGNTAQYEADLKLLRAQNKLPVTVKPTEKNPVIIGQRKVTFGFVIFIA